MRAFLISGPHFNFNSLILSQSTSTLLEERIRVAQDAAKVFYACFKDGFSEGGGITEMLALKDFQEQYPQSPVLNLVEAALSSIFNQIKTNSRSQESFEQLRQKYREEQVVDSTYAKSSIVDIAFDLCSQIIKIKTIVSANSY